MDGKEKLLVVVGGLIGAAFLLTSPSERVGRARELIWTAAKIAGFGWLGNTAFKIVTGKTFLNSVSDWTKDKVATSEFWNKHYKKSKSEEIEIMRLSTISMGDKDFMMLAKEYKKAKDLGQRTITLPNMGSNDLTPAQVYTAMEVFFNRYPVENLIQKYSLVKPPPPTWQQVVGAEMIDDKSIDMPSSLLNRTFDEIHSGGTRLWNKGAELVRPITGPKIEEKGRAVGAAGGHRGAAP